MLLDFKKINFEYLFIFIGAVFAGFLVSFYSLSVLFLLASILFVIISFQYFNQVLFLLVLYIPFQVALNIASGIDLASGRVFILYLFIVWIIRSLAKKKFIIRFNLQTLLICLFLFIAVFSMLQGWDKERAFRKVLVFLSIFPLYFIITSTSISSLYKKGTDAIENKNKYVYKILSMLFAGGLILSLIGVIQFVLQFFVGISPITNFWIKDVAPLFYGNTFGAEVVSNPSWLVHIKGVTVLRSFSLFPDPHMFSFYLGLIIPIVFAIILMSRSNFFSEKICFFHNATLLYIIFSVMFLAELFTFSRGGYVGMIAGIGVTIILLWKYISFNKKIILGLSALVLSLFLLFANQSIVNRFVSSFNLAEGSNIERMKNWNQGWEIFSNNMLTGVGIGNYSLSLYPTIGYRIPVYAHNLYLDIGAEMGIFELIVWLLLIGVTIWQLYKTSRKTKNDFSRALSLGLIGSLVWFSAHSFFDTPIYSPTILAIFVVIISLSVNLISSSEQ